MFAIRARNPHEALPVVMEVVKEYGVRNSSRNGDVLVLPEPVSIHYERPTERVIFWSRRDANPFFHLLESVWMLAGRQDVKFVADIVDNMRNFSDDGVIFHGAYGWRWRNLCGIDQIEHVVESLRINPNCRRQVIAMWDAERDFNHPDFSKAKDLPCNLSIVFQCSPQEVGSDAKRRLNMTVFNRSNDAVWGALGANCVHFSVLQEVIASACGFDVGWYEQITTNLHVYMNEVGQRTLELSSAAPDPYHRIRQNDSGYRHNIDTFPIDVPRIDKFLQECSEFCNRPEMYGLESPWLMRVVKPMYFSHRAWKNKADPNRYRNAVEILMSACEDCDWRDAALQWLHRRERNQK